VSGKSEPVLLKRLKRTSVAAPSQWEGETTDGRSVYVRYRWGVLRVEIDDKQVVETDAGEKMGSYMDEPELQQYWPYNIVA
jgi:hypothetical protein